MNEQKHDFDDDSVCTRCGFDGAEHHHLNKFREREDRDPEPACNPL